jgi:Domain of unknown function (DUF4920)
MKKLLAILPILFLVFDSIAQQTEDDPAVGGTWRTFGEYKTADTKNLKEIKTLTTISGTVINVSWCEEDCLTILLKTKDENTVLIGTKDYGFAVPKNIVHKKIIVQGYEIATLKANKKLEQKAFQKEVHIAATGIKIFD